MMSETHDFPANETLPAAIRVRLDELKRVAGESALRDFAIYCAIQVAGGNPCVMPTIKSVRVAARDSSGESLRRLHDKAGSAACAAFVIGLKVNPTSAAAQLAAFQCGRPDAYEAAAQTSKFVRDYFAFAVLEDPGAAGITARPALEAAACALGCQIDQLDRMLASCDPSHAEDEPDVPKGER